MRNVNKSINLNEWVSQAFLADKFSVTPGAVRNWIVRGQIDFMYVPELHTTLVKNLTSINELRSGKKKSKK